MKLRRKFPRGRPRSRWKLYVRIEVAETEARNLGFDNGSFWGL
jgi:hypothetical protein